ncbi:hypothetical protein ELY21_03570 [Legionella sp. km535]|uniref:transposase n=1 Tax=Legionella sp. km535 TaxID=2498107 RepID=UPI000F8EB48D|nr:hypothetical protein ELY21_03570 [Legionella sp. km535]
MTKKRSCPQRRASIHQNKPKPNSFPVCHLKRPKRHKTFDTTDQYRKTSVGWFFGLNIHLPGQL